MIELIISVSVLILIIIVLVFFILFFVFHILSFFTTDAPFVPIPSNIDVDVYNALNITDKQNIVLYDLGCGDGRVLLHAIKQNPSIRAVGVEIAFLPFFLAKWRTRKYPNIEIRRENIFTTDTSDATHIFVYLYPIVSKLFPILEKNCKPQTRIVSCDFECKEKQPTEIIDIEHRSGVRGKKIYVYTT